MPTSPPTRSPRSTTAPHTLSPTSCLPRPKPDSRSKPPRQLSAPPTSATLPLALAAALLLTGCANPGPPRPPSLNLPTPVSDLHADRIGNAVHLSWTTPTDTTDDRPLRGSITAVLCRTEPTRIPAPPTRAKPATRAGAAPSPTASVLTPTGTALSAAAPAPTAAPAAPPIPCTWSLRLAVSPGPSTATDPLTTSTQTTSTQTTSTQTTSTQTTSTQTTSTLTTSTLTTSPRPPPRPQP